MSAELAHLAALRDISQGILHTFGWQAARTKGGRVKAIGVGEHAGAKPLYGKKAEAALSQGKGKGGAKPAAKPQGKSPPSPLGALPNVPDTEGAAKPGFSPFQPAASAPRGPVVSASPGLGTVPPPAVPMPPTPGGRTVTGGVKFPPKQGAAKPTPPAPRGPTPAESARLDEQEKADTAKYGPKQAGILKRAMHVLLRGLEVAGGAAIGAAMGFGLSGGNPLGALGGGLMGAGWGGLTKPLSKEVRMPTAARAMAGGRKVARSVLPGLAGAAAVGGPIGVGAGAGMKVLTGKNTTMDYAKDTAKAARLALAKSPAAKRRAARDNKNLAFSEMKAVARSIRKFADELITAAQPDPIALLKQRLAEFCAARGIPVPEDHVIQDALAKVANAPAGGMAQ